MNSVTTPTIYPPDTYDCEVLDITPLSKSTYEVELQTTAGELRNYRAGQYLQLNLDLNNDGQKTSLSYSIANRLNLEQPRRLQIFIHNSSQLTDKILKHLSELKNKKSTANVKLPMGLAFFQTNLALPHFLIAAGSGISKIKCIAEEILSRKKDSNINIYWSNKYLDEFYLLDEFQDWAIQNKNLKFTPILESPDTDWPGASGYIYKVIKSDFYNFYNTKFYLCGSPQMVYGTIDKLKTNGLNEQDCYSDVFEYAPRHKKIAI